MARMGEADAVAEGRERSERPEGLSALRGYFRPPNYEETLAQRPQITCSFGELDRAEARWRSLILTSSLTLISAPVS